MDHNEARRIINRLGGMEALENQLKGLCPKCGGERPKESRCCCTACFLEKKASVRIPTEDGEMTKRWACADCPLADRTSLKNPEFFIRKQDGSV